MLRVVRAEPFIGKEEKQPVFHHRPTDAAAELAQLVFDALLLLQAGKAVEGVQPGFVVLEEEAPVKIIRAVLRNHFYLCAGISPVLCRITVGENGYFLDRLLARSHNRGASPGKAVHTHAVNGVVVRGDALPIRANGELVFGLIDGIVRAAGSARCLRPGAGPVWEPDRPTIASPCQVAEDPWRQAHQFIRVASELRQPLNLLRRQCGGRVRILGLDPLRRSGNCDGLADRPHRELYVESADRFGGNLHVLGHLGLESVRLHLDVVFARRQG